MPSGKIEQTDEAVRERQRSEAVPVMSNMNHMNFLQAVCDEDMRELRRKEETYKGSWKKRGGVGAFMMMARKWDRLEIILSDKNTRYDVFEKIMYEGGGGEDGSVLAEIRDLRRYLILIEAEMMARDIIDVPAVSTSCAGGAAFRERTTRC